MAKTKKIPAKHNSKVDIDKCIEMIEKNISQRDIANYFGVTSSAINQIKSRYYVDFKESEITAIDDIEKANELELIQAKILKLFSISKLNRLTANSLADVFIKINNVSRLLQNKSTENIAIANIHKLDDKTLQIVEQAIKGITNNALKASRDNAIKQLKDNNIK